MGLQISCNPRQERLFRATNQNKEIMMAKKAKKADKKAAKKGK
jgi:hypothetical protein